MGFIVDGMAISLGPIELDRQEWKICFVVLCNITVLLYKFPIIAIQIRITSALKTKHLSRYTKPLLPVLKAEVCRQREEKPACPGPQHRPVTLLLV